ncbi:MAG: hypothetical protein NT069_22960 [Planctomycetota bacterium]|nr:hypothetical protein [Planctomycetota bacterium]
MHTWGWRLLAVALLIALCPDSASAMRFWRFTISRDGQPVMTGGIGMHDQTPPRTVLQHLPNAGIQLGTDSILDPATTGDFTLTGDVRFQFPELPELALPQLRLVYVPDPARDSRGATVAGGFYDWHVHPDDARLILTRLGADPPADESQLPAGASGTPRRQILQGTITGLSIIALLLTGILMRNRHKLPRASE